MEGTRRRREAPGPRSPGPSPKRPRAHPSVRRTHGSATPPDARLAGALGQVPRLSRGESPGAAGVKGSRFRHKQAPPRQAADPPIYSGSPRAAPLHPGLEPPGPRANRPPARKEKHAPALFFSPPGRPSNRGRRLARRPAETSAVSSSCRRFAPGSPKPSMGHLNSPFPLVPSRQNAPRLLPVAAHAESQPSTPARRGVALPERQIPRL
jgi:hypothetical protein